LIEYTYNNPDIPSRKVVIKPAPVILLEGLFIMCRQDLRDLLDLKVFVHAMEHIMLTRRIIRDEKERGYDLNDVLYRYRHHVMPSFRKYILPYREECDVVINNNQDFKEGLRLLTGYIDKLLQKTIS
jgi:uridine kinase